MKNSVKSSVHVTAISRKKTTKITLKKLFSLFLLLFATQVFAALNTIELLYFLKNDVSPEAICLFKGVNNKVECKGATKPEAVCMLQLRNNRYKCKGVKLPQAVCMLGGIARGKSSCEEITDINEAICLTDGNNTKSTCEGVKEAEAICLSGGRGQGMCKGVDMTQALCLYGSGSSKSSCTF